MTLTQYKIPRKLIDCEYFFMIKRIGTLCSVLGGVKSGLSDLDLGKRQQRDHSYSLIDLILFLLL